MKKRLTAALMGTALLSTSLLGSGIQVAAESGDDLVEIVWQWPSTGTIGDGFQDVEDALNEMLEKDIGVHVTLYPVNASNLINQTVLDVTGGEQVDLSLSIGKGVGSLVSSGLIQPLDDIVEQYGSAIVETTGNGLYGGYYDGQLYGVPNAWVYGLTYAYVARKDILEKYGFEADFDKVYTLDEIEEIFEVVKAGEGENFYCVAPDPTSKRPLSGSAFEYDFLGGGSVASGVLMLNESFDNLKIENMFETPEFEEYARRMYDWAQKGYISKDAAVSTEDPKDQVKAGNVLGTFSYGGPYNNENNTYVVGRDMVTMHVIPGYVASAGLSNILWSVPITSANPEKAIETLNYIYEHDEATWLLQFGIRDRDYEIVEQTEEGARYHYLADDPSTLPYYQPYGVYGNRLHWPVRQTVAVNYNNVVLEYEESIPDSRKSPAMGYVFKQDSVATEISAVTAVIEQYITSINCGTVEPGANLESFRKDLKAAGIDKVIEENQRQLDEWAANK